MESLTPPKNRMWFLIENAPTHDTVIENKDLMYHDDMLEMWGTATYSPKGQPLSSLPYHDLRVIAKRQGITEDLDSQELIHCIVANLRSEGLCVTI